MVAATLKAPFPAFGGKAKIADLVWSRLGDVDNYVEPFCNSAAVLLARPTAPRIETLNDWDCYVANFWRATASDPAAVAAHADNPVNEADLHARHRWLVLSEHAAEFRQRMRTDPEYYDARVAGWWVWGACCWIGSGWCAEPGGTCNGPPGGSAERRPALSGEQAAASGKQPGIGVNGGLIQPALSQCLPKLGQFSGKAVPECSADPRRGLSDTHRPQLADAYSLGRGVHAGQTHAERATKRPVIANSGGGGHGVTSDGPLGRSGGTCAERQAWLLDWFNRLRDRLRTVRVCCGDWQRVCDSPSTTTRLGLTGLFLDPPYRTRLDDGKSNRADGLYASDRDADVNALVDRVIAYCVDRGSDPQMRIAVCGYEGEGYEVLTERHRWTVEAWQAGGGYSNIGGKANDNASRERVWFSPACKADAQASLF
jgi:hypothetical protein